jgi:hypothetical protein
MIDRLPNLILRIGVAFAFLYPPFAALRDPLSWLAYFPPFLLHLGLPDMLLLHGFGLVEVVIALWVLWGKHIQYPAALATLMLLSIVYFNAGQFDVVFRDLSIACMSASLGLQSWLRRPRPLAQPRMQG